ncbi:MAG: type III-B CRISPR module RAMP protein Cmr6 [Candidatus Omnitrophica bacterium]|nr:type III-B CRISPR module RAMP protein Cmr6 [Candidatus Omnitrophota bacterium]
MMKMPLNSELERILDNFKNPKNLNLLLTKYINEWNIDNNQYNIESKQIGFYLEKITKASQISKNIYPDFLKRWELLLKETKATAIKAKVEWRLVVGLGSGFLLDRSMTVHHILGFPFIPGSALKGVLRTYYLEKNREPLIKKMNEENEKLKDQGKREKLYKSTELDIFAQEKDEIFIKIFGNQKTKGKIIFFDAYPTRFPELELDIMNPHYPDYYTGTTPPADWQTPSPIKFLTVKKDTEFIFAFRTCYEDIKNEVRNLIEESLSDIGIGAKTSVGYGYFKDFQDLKFEIIEEHGVEKTAKSTSNEQSLPGYLKNQEELKDEYLNPDGSFKTEEEYKNYLASKNIEYTKKRRQMYEKAKNWVEKKKGSNK